MELVDAQTSAPAGPDPNHPHRITLEKLRVLHDYLVIQPLAPPSKKAGGLMFMPEAAGERERSHRGIVLQHGPGDFNEAGTALVPMSIQPGDLVFFGKYAGTEEEIGGGSVIVMREAECRFCVPAGAFEVVAHPENPKLNHLVEDWCDVCHGIPLEEEAKARLEQERQAAANASNAVCRCGHVASVHAHRTGPCNSCDDCMEFTLDAHISAETAPAPADLAIPTPAEINFIKAEKTPTVTSVSFEKRPCLGTPTSSCVFMQRKVGTVDGPMWVGLRCGHWHPAIELAS